MREKAIVTLADSNYFDLLVELIKSIQANEESKNISICVLDAGLNKNQIKILSSLVYSIKKANWDIEVPSYKIMKKEWLKSQVSRAFLPNYFPEFKKYLWIDSDAIFTAMITDIPSTGQADKAVPIGDVLITTIDFDWAFN